jgi:hypothetical protein
MSDVEGGGPESPSARRSSDPEVSVTAPAEPEDGGESGEGKAAEQSSSVEDGEGSADEGNSPLVPGLSLSVPKGNKGSEDLNMSTDTALSSSDDESDGDPDSEAADEDEDEEEEEGSGASGGSDAESSAGVVIVDDGESSDSGSDVDDSGANASSEQTAQQRRTERMEKKRRDMYEWEKRKAARMLQTNQNLALEAQEMHMGLLSAVMCTGEWFTMIREKDKASATAGELRLQLDKSSDALLYRTNTGLQSKLAVPDEQSGSCVQKENHFFFLRDEG